MTHPLLERHLKSGKIRPVYLFYGEEEFLMHRAAARLYEALRDKFGKRR